MPTQNNFIRPSSTFNSASSTKLDSTEIARKKTSVVILTLLSMIIFLFVLSLLLICALFVVGNGLAAKRDKPHTEFNSEISSISLINRAINADKNAIDTSDSKFNKKFDMTIGKMASKLVENLTFRLPSAIRPTYYNLFLHPNLDTKKFSGNVKISFNVSEPVSFVALHSKFLNVTTNKLIKQLENGAEGIPIKSAFEYEKFEFFIVEPETQLATGKYILDLNFEGNLVGKLVGFYGSSYYDKTRNKTRYMATSKFEPTFARQAFPCFDEPSMKAPFKISVIRPEGDNYSALSNMNEISSEAYEPGLVKVDFAESVPMSTYLTVFIVSDFVSTDATINPSVGDSFQVRCFGTQAQLNKLDFALNVSVDVIQYYIDYFKIAYPLPKLDLAAIPDFVSGAMETWGLVTFRETSLLYDPTISSSANKQRVAFVISHEFAHMWFGNLVTMKWWSDLWLNEGFASYIEFKGVAAALPEWKIEDIFTVDTMHGILNLDATVGSHPIVVGVETPEQITEIFDSVTYSKGASIIRMMEDFIGPEKFQTGVSEYLAANKFGNADSDDLVKHLEGKIDEEVKPIVDTWIRQKGLPVVTVEQEGNRFTLTQKRFLTDPDAVETLASDFSYRWSIPITYVTSGQPNDVKREWFMHDVEKITVIVDDEEEIDWIKFNKNQVGYYRVKYDESMWKKLNDALETDINSMSVLDRAHLLNDAFSLAEGLEVPYATALTMTKYLKAEDHFVPWDVVSSKLNGIRNLLYYTELNSKFKEYVVQLVDDAYTNLTWEVNPDEHLNNYFRSTILSLACSMDHPDCIEKVGQLFLTWINGPDAENNRPTPDLRSLIYTYGMRSKGTQAEWDRMFSLFEMESDATEKSKLQSALAAINQPWILRKYIDLAADERYVRGQDYFSLMGSIASNRVGEAIVWDYVREYWPEISSRFGLGERNLGRMIPTITSRFTTKTKLDEMNNFFEKYPEAGAGANARIQALEAVANNIKWLEINQKPIGEWLN